MTNPEKIIASQIQYDGTIRLATGLSRREMHWHNTEMLWSEFAHKLSEPTRTPETFEAYKSMPKVKQGMIKDVGGFVGGTLKGGRRKADALAWRSLITLDMDNLSKLDDPWPTVEMVLGCAAVLYSTHSHKPQAPRLRLIIPLSRQVKPDEYAAVARRVAADIGIDFCDDSTFEHHRLMYWPSVSCDAEYRYEFSDGPWLDVEEQLARYDDWQDPSQWPHSSRKDIEIRKAATKQGDPLEKTGIVGAFCRVYTVEDAIEKFLPEVYLRCENGRYTYAEGSTIGGLVVYDNGKFAYSNHGTDPAGGRLCNAFDLVRVHLYRELDDEADPATPVNKTPSHIKMSEFALTDAAVRENLAIANTTAVVDALTEDEDEIGISDSADTDWLAKLELDSRGKIKSTTNNVFIILQHDERLAGKYAYDDFKGRPIVLGNLPWQRYEKRISPNWADSDDAGLRHYVERKYGLSSVNKIYDAVEVAMLRSRIHPVRDYLTGLQWDGTKRVGALLIEYLGAEDCEYTREVTKRALIGAVARIMKPGCKHDHMLVLVGPQGCGKSTLLSRLGGKWFSDSVYTLTGKSAYEQLLGYWILEMGEMAAARKAEVEQMKLFFSKCTDNYRAAYGHRTQDHPRQCAFFGSTNDEEFLKDNTGNRRFWPVVVQNAGKNLYRDLSQEVVAQIWAEALAYYNAGELWYLDAKMEKLAKSKQQEHTEVDSRQGLVEQFLEKLLPKKWMDMELGDRLDFWFDSGFSERKEGVEPRKVVCALEIWQELFKGDVKNFRPMDARAINNIVRNIPGWEPQSSYLCGKPYGRQRAFVRKEQEDLQQ